MTQRETQWGANGGRHNRSRTSTQRGKVRLEHLEHDGVNGAGYNAVLQREGHKENMSCHLYGGEMGKRYLCKILKIKNWYYMSSLLFGHVYFEMWICASMCLFYTHVFMLQKMSDRMSEYFSEKMSDKMSEYSLELFYFWFGIKVYNGKATTRKWRLTWNCWLSTKWQLVACGVLCSYDK